MTLRVYIDRLVLDGFALQAGDAGRVRHAVEQELARLLGSQASEEIVTGNQHSLRQISLAAGAVPSVRAGTFNPPKKSNPAQLGRHIAQSIHGGIGKPGE
jgi:hypothetical protein